MTLADGTDTSRHVFQLSPSDKVAPPHTVSFRQLVPNTASIVQWL